MRDWVFLDVGNVLLDEDRLTWFVLQKHAEAIARVRPEVTLREVVARFDRALTSRARWPLYEAVRDDLDDSELAAIWDSTTREARARYRELCPLIPGAREAIERLARRYEEHG